MATHSSSRLTRSHSRSSSSNPETAEPEENRSQTSTAVAPPATSSTNTITTSAVNTSTKNNNNSSNQTPKPRHTVHRGKQWQAWEDRALARYVVHFDPYTPGSMRVSNEERWETIRQAIKADYPSFTRTGLSCRSRVKYLAKEAHKKENSDAVVIAPTDKKAIEHKRLVERLVCLYDSVARTRIDPKDALQVQDDDMEDVLEGDNDREGGEDKEQVVLIDPQVQQTSNEPMSSQSQSENQSQPLIIPAPSQSSQPLPSSQQQPPPPQQPYPSTDPNLLKRPHPSHPHSSPQLDLSSHTTHSPPSLSTPSTTLHPSKKRRHHLTSQYHHLLLEKLLDNEAEAQAQEDLEAKRHEEMMTKFTERHEETMTKLSELSSSLRHIPKLTSAIEKLVEVIGSGNRNMQNQR